MRSYELDPPARRELLEATRRYRAQADWVARDFGAEVRRAIRFILVHPEGAPVVTAEGARRKTLRRFPYSLFYLIEPTVIRIMAVAHQSRRPGYWTDRL